MELKKVDVTRIGALTPIGNTVSEFLEGMTRGVSGAALITKFDISNFRTKFACELKNFDPLDHLDKKEARKMDPFTQYALISAKEAIENSQIDLDKIDKDRAGIIWAAGIGGLKTFEEEILNFASNNEIPRFNPFFIPKMIPDISAGYLSIKYGFRGPNFATVSACASATNV